MNSNATFEIFVFSGKIIYKTCFYFLEIKSKMTVEGNETLRQDLVVLNASWD